MQKLFHLSRETMGALSRKASIALEFEKELSPGSTTNKLGTRNDSWNKDTFYALGLYRLMAHSVGIWPLQCQNISSEIRFFGVIISQVFMVYNLIEELRSGCVSMSIAVHFVSVIASSIIGLVKILMIRIHRIKMSRIVASAVNDWAIERDDNSRKIMHGYALFGRSVCKFESGFAYATIVMLFLDAPLTLDIMSDKNWQSTNISDSPLRNLPIGTGCSVKDTPAFLYIIFYFFQLFQLLILVNCNTGMDCFFFGFAMHICSQFELLKIYMTQFGSDLDDANASAELATLIERQNHLTKLCSYIEDIFHVVILGQLTGTAVQIAFVGVRMLLGLQNKDFDAVFLSVIAISILCAQLFLYSYVGDYLASQISGLRDSAYNCSWYNFSQSLTKNVKFVMMRSTDSFNLTAGKVYRMNIKNFTSIIKTIASFFSVVKLMLAE